MNYEDRELKIGNYNSYEEHKNFEYKDKSQAFNQLILISIILMFYLNWSTAKIHTTLVGVLPLLTAVMLAVLVLLNINIIYKDKYQFFLIMLIPIITLIGMIVNGSKLGVLFVIVNFSLMLLVSGSIKITK